MAHEGNLTRAAAKAKLSQSALSSQIKKLEDRLGYPLFDRVGRQLEMTEVGRIVLDHADQIFGTGQELLATLQRTSAATPPLRVGATSTLSRNFQIQFLDPFLRSPETDLVLRSGSDSVLFDALKSLSVDVVLTTEPPHSVFSAGLTAQRIARQPVGIHGTPGRLKRKTLNALLNNEPLILPTASSIRTGFEALITRLAVTPRIVAEVDDMAMLRLLARQDVGLAIAPAVVLADEIAAGMLQTAPFDLQIEENFYAVTVRRNFPHPVLKDLLST